MKSFESVCIKLVLLFALCSSVSARLFYWPGQSSYSQYEVFKTGRSNVNFDDCGNDNYIFQLDKDIKVTPEIVTPGGEVTIEAEGTLSRTVEEGAYAHIVVKLGAVRLLSKTFDLCEELRKDENELQCPFEKGKFILKQTVKLPKEIPRARFVVYAQAFTVDDDPVACQVVKVDFLNHRRNLNNLVNVNLGQY